MTMAQFDPSATQADLSDGIAVELAAAGFIDPRAVGRGGFGVVYRCKQVELGRTVAVKVLSTVLDDDNYERFHREEYVMGRLSGHPNIATILQIGTLSGGRPYIVMPFYPDGSLDALVRRQGPCEWTWAVRVGVKLAGALETAHRAGILHRDVKPANILLTEYSDPQLTDFGIARIAGGFETGTGKIAGSLAFTAPEVLGGASPSVAADVYSLGATLFNLIAGRPAFGRKPGEELVAQFLRITTQDIPDLRVQGVPAGLSDVVKSAMARDPADRAPTAAALGEQLRALQREHGIALDEMAVPSGDAAPNPVTIAPHVDGGGRVAKVPAPQRLPIPLTSFVGRDREVREVSALLAGNARLVTLTGPGGVGKTRMAVQVAARLEPSIPGGVWFVELGNVLEADQLAHVVADALSLGDEPMPAKNTIGDLGRRLARAWGTRRVLIVLDNCEHLMAVCGPMIEQLLNAVPGLQLLVTSQQVFGIAGEHICVVPPLSLPDPDDIDCDSATLDRLMHHEAIELFIDRAEAVVPGFTMTDDDRLNVARLCAQLDGIPLVLELAAARLRTFGITELLQIISDRFRLLSTGSSTAQPRHRTLRALVDWSYQLLSPDESEIWLFASLFAGEFTADAVVEVCAGPSRTAQDVRFVLASLVDKSMVASTARSGVHRYRLLVSLREYAAQRLAESGHRNVTVERYVSRYRRIAEEFRRDWFSHRQVDVFTAVHEERENLRAALSYCQSGDRLSAIGALIVTSLHYYWLASTTLTEARRWLAAVIHSPEVDPSTRARALCSAAIVSVIQNDIDVAEKDARASHELARRCDDLRSVGYASLALGMVALCREDMPTGIAKYQAALECQRAVADSEGSLATTTALIAALAQTDATARAAVLWEEAVAQCELADDRWNLAYLMYARGYQRYTLGDLDAASFDQLASLRLSRPFADRILVAFAVEVLSWIAARQGDAEGAARMWGAASASWASSDASVVHYGGAMTQQRHEVDALMRRLIGDERTAELIGEGKAIGAETVVAELLSEP
jgi:predicted ATPase